MKKVLSIMLFSTLLLTTSCSVEKADDTLEENNVSFLEQLANLSTSRGPLPSPPIWADCDLYSGLVVPASFSPVSDSFDELYAGTMFKDGVPLISDSRPGDKDYNGGRWHLNVLKAGVDPAKYSDACKEMDLDPADFNSTDMYFECPLRPRRN